MIVLKQDYYYKDISAFNGIPPERINFDHPEGWSECGRDRNDSHKNPGASLASVIPYPWEGGRNPKNTGMGSKKHREESKKHRDGIEKSRDNFEDILHSFRSGTVPCDSEIVCGEMIGHPRLRETHWDPIYATSQERHMSLNFHIGFGGFDSTLGVNASFQCQAVEVASVVPSEADVSANLA